MLIYFIFHIVCSALALALIIKDLGKLTLDWLMIAVVAGPIALLAAICALGENVVIYRKK